MPLRLQSGIATYGGRELFHWALNRIGLAAQRRCWRHCAAWDTRQDSVRRLEKLAVARLSSKEAKRCTRVGRAEACLTCRSTLGMRTLLSGFEKAREIKRLSPSRPKICSKRPRQKHRDAVAFGCDAGMWVRLDSCKRLDRQLIATVVKAIGPPQENGSRFSPV